MKVEEIMKRDVKACGQDDNLNSAAQLMWDTDCGCVPVLASDGAGKIVGMITDRDVCYARSLYAARWPPKCSLARQATIYCRPK